jgi:hypothetical protein
MIGAIAGDIIGSVYENNPIKTKVYRRCLLWELCRLKPLLLFNRTRNQKV